jgi:uncharacterized protein (TIGR02246 family)
MAKRLWQTLVLLVCCAATLETSAQTKNDEAAIRSLIEAHAVAWNKRDVKAAASVYSDDATIVTGSGRTFVGREAVEKWHHDALTGPLPSTHTHPPETLQIHFLAPDIAVADVESKSPGVVGSDGQQGPPRIIPLFIVIVKRAGGWRVAAQRQTVTMPKPTQRQE